MKKWNEVRDEWSVLIELAQKYYVFGKKLDTEFFKKCMKDAFDILSVGKENKESFSWGDVVLMNMIFGYSCIPAVTDSEFSDEFKVSTHAAADLLDAMAYPGDYLFEDNKIIYNDTMEREIKPVVFDFETGD